MYPRSRKSIETRYLSLILQSNQLEGYITTWSAAATGAAGKPALAGWRVERPRARHTGPTCACWPPVVGWRHLHEWRERVAHGAHAGRTAGILPAPAVAFAQPGPRHSNSSGRARQCATIPGASAAGQYTSSRWHVSTVSTVSTVWPYFFLLTSPSVQLQNKNKIGRTVDTVDTSDAIVPPRPEGRCRRKPMACRCLRFFVRP